MQTSEGLKASIIIFLFIIVLASYGQRITEATRHHHSNHQRSNSTSAAVQQILSSASTNSKLTVQQLLASSQRFLHNLTNNVSGGSKGNNQQHHNHHHHHHGGGGGKDPSDHHGTVPADSDRDNNDLEITNDLHDGPPRVWNYGIVPYEISHRLYKYRDMIEHAMKHISQNAACVQFLPRNDDIWEDYIEIEWSDENRCRSSVGRQGGAQTLLLGQACMTPGTIIHELMHVLGFHHEHNRPDRDRYLDIHWGNIDPNNWDNFELLKKRQWRNLTEFDFQSIMMYGEYSFSDNMRPTMTAKDPTIGFSGSRDKKRLSHLDIEALRQLYCN